MKYKGLDWEKYGTEDEPEKRALFSGFVLCVFPDPHPNIDPNMGWMYEVLDCLHRNAMSEGFHFATEEQAMREAIFDAMVLKLKDSQ